MKDFGENWEHFYHEADIGVRGQGQSLAKAFEQAALAMTAVITELDTIRSEQCVEIECRAPDNELLLVDWLNALIYEMATRKMLFSRFEVQLENQHLYGKAWGENIAIDKHHPVVEIKGATYTELKITQNSQGAWQVQCVVDV